MRPSVGLKGSHYAPASPFAATKCIESTDPRSADTRAPT